MQKFSVQGMSCAACSARVENAVSKIEGVTACNVSLLTNSMTVEGNINVDDVITAVKNAGYSAALDSNENIRSSDIFLPFRQVVPRPVL